MSKLSQHKNAPMEPGQYKKCKIFRNFRIVGGYHVHIFIQDMVSSVNFLF